MKSKKAFYVAKASFAYAIISLSPLLFMVINYLVDISKVLDLVMRLASLSIYFGLYTGIYAMYEINKKKLGGMQYAITGTAVAGMLTILFILRTLS